MWKGFGQFWGKGGQSGGGEPSKGGGKGKGGKDAWWNYNPIGAGYQGICWGCGEVGHKQNECKGKGNNKTKKKVQGVEEGREGQLGEEESVNTAVVEVAVFLDVRCG